MDKKIFSKVGIVVGGVIVVVITLILVEFLVDFSEKGCGLARDAEGNEYGTVEIGEQCWFAENLKTKKYRNGEPISEAENHIHADDAWNTGKPAYTWHNYRDFKDKEKEYIEKHGYLYNFHVVNYQKEKEDEGYKVCPEGWRVPTHDDWTELERFVCEDNENKNCQHSFPYDERKSGYFGTDEGNSLKARNFVGTEAGSNGYGFNAVPGGLRYKSGSFSPLYYASWWSSTVAGNRVWVRELYDTESGIGRLLVEKERGHHIRCIKE